MSKSKTPKFIKNVGATIRKHGPEILTGFGVAAGVTSTILAVKATPKAIRILEEEKLYVAEESGYLPEEIKIPPIDMVKLCWKCYIPAAVTGTVAMACIIGASSANVRRNAALATAYKLSETALSEYRDKVVETIGEKKEELVRDKVNQERVDKTPVDQTEVIVTGKGDTLILDHISGRYFKSKVDLVKKAEIKLNQQMLQSFTGYASVNDFYDEIGLERISVGDDLGWNTENLVKIRVGSTVVDEDTPCIVIDHINPPKYGYDR